MVCKEYLATIDDLEKRLGVLGEHKRRLWVRI